MDRYSGWPSVCLCKTESAQELVSCLRAHFVTWGSPEEIATDGGPAYVAAAT